MRTTSFRRAGAVSALAAGLLVVSAGAASAHECYVANRSAQGNTAAGSYSEAWESVTLDTILTQFIGVPAPVATCVEAKAAEAGVPSEFVFGGKQAVGQGGVIAENNPNFDAKGLAADGQGIDHAEDTLGPILFPLIEECSS